MQQDVFLSKITFRIQPEDEEVILTVLQEQLNYNTNIYKEPSWQEEEIQMYVPVEEKSLIKDSITYLIKELIELEIITDREYILSDELLKEEDWMNHWKKYFEPILVGKKLQITPFWYEPSKERINLLLEPKMGFGTGQHATTFLCLEAMEKIDMQDKSIIDIGAGSGILGVSSVLLGAKESVMIEIDKLSIESCQDTIKRNHVENKIVLLTGDIFTMVPEEYQKQYDAAFINIIAEVIVDILSIHWLKQVPLLFLSGILISKKDKVLEVIKKSPWKVVEEKIMGDWVLFVVTQ